MEIKLLSKYYKGIFISWGKYWKGIYFHFPNFTIRLFLWGVDGYSTKHFNKMIRANKSEQ